MAILEAIPGVKVTVCIDGVDCPEYDDPTVPEQQAGPPIVTKYIESPDNATFTTSMVVDKNYVWGKEFYSLGFNHEVDGNCIYAPLIRRTDILNGDLQKAVVDGKQSFCNDTKSWVKQKLKFSAVKIVGDATKDRVKKDRQATENLGLIEAISWENIERPEYVTVVPFPSDNGSIAIFRFKYRSKRALRQEMVIPRTPSASPSLDGLSPAEITRLAKEGLRGINMKKQLDEKLRAVKREISEDFDLATNDIPARPAKVRRLTPEVVDLTDD
ncbi:hypothetical protein F5Y11DRAFT_349291 [Daldinia sp. FL1419]|nr:hypothetical protein F5Y11DRAFT_349291 [Daldinia sp. FL1419]